MVAGVPWYVFDVIAGLSSGPFKNSLAAFYMEGFSTWKNAVFLNGSYLYKTL